MFILKCPVDERGRTWITENINWLRARFGDAPLSAPMTLPTRTARYIAVHTQD